MTGVLARARAARARYFASSVDALEDVGKEILAVAEAEVPVLPPDEVRKGTQASGALASTGEAHVEHVPGGAVLRVTFSGPHAVKQHEAKHFKHPHGGKAHFLSDPLKAKTGTLRGELARGTARRMREGA